MSQIPFHLTTTQLDIFTHKIASILGSQMDLLQLEYSISPRALKDTVTYFLRDLERLELQQYGSISISKYCGYLGFWIRKVKPIRFAFPKNATNDEIDKMEITNINEIVAFKVSLYMLHKFRQCSRTVSLADAAYKNCCKRRAESQKKQCNGISCLEKYISESFADDQATIDYITHAMRYRTFGPHHLVATLEQLLHGSCLWYRALEPSSVRE